MNAKKIASIILALLMVFSISVSAFANDLEPTVDNANPDRSTIASIIYQNFYSSSGGSTITLSKAINYISLKVTCASGSDYMTAFIDDLSHGGTYDSYISFNGNGSTTTVHCYLPAGSYNVTLLGTYKLHTYGFVAFST